jgi:hypothetical protein
VRARPRTDRPVLRQAQDEAPSARSVIPAKAGIQPTDASHPPAFLPFLDVWNALQGLETPALHVDIALWLERRLADPLLLLLAFRGSGKSTLVGLYAAWRLSADPDTRILVLSADQALAGKMARSVKRIVERHPLCRGLKPDRPDQWAADRFTVRRRRESRDPSMLARGVSANVTGSHADLIVCDDVEVPNTCDTAPKRADLRARLGELENVLVPGGTQLYVGTPHTWWSIYADEVRPETGEARPFLDGASRCVKPVFRPDGSSAWPERFPADAIERIRRRSGPNRFSSQMLLRPVNVAEGRLDPDLMRPYDHALDRREALGRAVLKLGDRRLVSAAAWWDPSFGRADGDGSVVACVFADADGRRYLHDVRWISVPPGDEAAQAQCRAVAAFVADNHLPAIDVEANGIGTFLPGLLRRALADAGVPAAVRTVSNRRPKVLRILEAWDVALAAGSLHAHRRIWETRLVAEMRSWRPDRPDAGHDDGLDAVAGCLSADPVRLGPAPRAAPRPDWRPGAGQGRAETDFDPRGGGDPR